MTIFVYGPSHPTNHNVSNFGVLKESLVLSGVTDAEQGLSLDVDLSIDTVSGTQAQCDAAVIQADKDGLLHAQTIKIKEIIGNSPDLLDVGFKVSIGTTNGKFSLIKPNSNYGFYEALEDKVARTPGILPFQLLDSDKVLINIDNAAKVIKLANQAFQRIKYIYFDQTNADASLGEAGYVILIRAADDVDAVDEILDSRV